MYDGFKLQLPKSMKEKLLDNDLLDFKSIFSQKTGAVNGKLTASYPTDTKDQLLKFTINGNYIEVAGSFHKYWQNGTNYQVYSFDDFMSTLNEFQLKFDIDPYEAIVHNLEIGLNIELDGITANELIQNCMLYKNKEFDTETFESKGRLKRTVLSQYEVKIYDKGIQNNVGSQLLRVEKKVKWMQKLGTVKLIELTNYKFIGKAGLQLINLWNDVIVFEPKLSELDLSKPQKRLVSDWSNTNYLNNIAKTNKRKFESERIKYKKLIENKLVDNFQVLKKIINDVLLFHQDAKQSQTND